MYRCLLTSGYIIYIHSMLGEVAARSCLQSFQLNNAFCWDQSVSFLLAVRSNCCLISGLIYLCCLEASVSPLWVPAKPRMFAPSTVCSNLCLCYHICRVGCLEDVQLYLSCVCLPFEFIVFHHLAQALRYQMCCVGCLVWTIDNVYLSCMRTLWIRGVSSL